MSYSIGERVGLNADGGEMYIIAQTGSSKVALIHLGNGNRFREPIEVHNVRNITDAEMQLIGGAEFELCDNTDEVYTEEELLPGNVNPFKPQRF